MLDSAKGRIIRILSVIAKNGLGHPMPSNAASPNPSYRSLELICRRQAEQTMHPDARKELGTMALEYQRIVDYLERQQPANQQQE